MERIIGKLPLIRIASSYSFQELLLGVIIKNNNEPPCSDFRPTPNFRHTQNFGSMPNFRSTPIIYRLKQPIQPKQLFDPSHLYTNEPRHAWYYTDPRNLADSVVIDRNEWIQFRCSHHNCSLRKDVLRNFVKFIGKHLCQSLFFTLKKRLRCFLGNFAKFLRTPFLQNTSSGCFCQSYLALYFLNTLQLLTHFFLDSCKFDSTDFKATYFAIPQKILWRTPFYTPSKHQKTCVKYPYSPTRRNKNFSHPFLTFSSLKWFSIIFPEKNTESKYIVNKYFFGRAMTAINT